MASTKSINLTNWQWRQVESESSWSQCKHSKSTTEIFTDLLDAGLIPDPFLDQNEKDVQWVGEKSWEYALDFDYTPTVGHQFQDLLFEGLDTIATVFLNDREILHSENMFQVHRVRVNNELVHGSNRLRIVFASALEYGRKQEASHEKLALFNGESSRLYVRKAQYHYGWDWGPVLMTCGPYKPVVFQSYTSLIEDVYIDPRVKEDLKSADVNISFSVISSDDFTVHLEVFEPISHELVFQGSTDIVKGVSTGALKFNIENPELWFPLKYGPQNLYTFKFSLKSASHVHDVITKTVGIRRLELVQHALKDQPGTSFFFQINNIPIYAAGSNWIPGHSFLTRMTVDDYKKWVGLAIEGNQIMLRVWGGGIYEHEVFYEECDRKGLLVWQDFMFGCGQYPYHHQIAESIQKEAADQVKRLRNYCSIVIYAGNNEDYQVAEQKNLTWDKSDLSGDYTDTDFPARTLYERDLPKIMKRFCSTVPYHPGSPWGGEFTNDPTVGDIHQWNVWHGSQEKYQNWSKLGGRFISEFGMLSFPASSTIDKFATDPAQRYPQSEVLDHHQRSDGFERRLALYVIENLRVKSMDLESWIYATQLMQAECLAYAYRCWKREWKGPSREYIGGALVWQLNDCWPGMSWAIVDHYFNPKLAYYAVKRESSQIGLGIYRTTTEDKKKNGFLAPMVNGPPHDLVEKSFVYDVWGVNLTLSSVKAQLDVRHFDIKTGQEIRSSVIEAQTVRLESNRTTELCEDISVSNNVAVQARLVDFDGNVLARASDWPQPLKHVIFSPDQKVNVEVREGQVTVTVNTPIKGLELYLADNNIRVEWADNGVDVFPGDPYIIEARGLKSHHRILTRFYGQ